MTEKQTQPSAIAQAAAEEWWKKDWPNSVNVYVAELAALIDKHIEPLTRPLKDECTCFWCATGFPFPRKGTRLEQADALTAHAMNCQEHPFWKYLNAEATVRSQAEEIERLKKLIDRAHTEFVYISEAPTFELCKSTEMYELIDLLKPQP